MASANVIHDMSETLVHLLRTSIPPAMVDPSRIYVTTPDEFETLQKPGQPHITLFLYRIAENPQMRNRPRRFDPKTGATTKDLLPLELNYLVTAWAKDTRDELRIIGHIAQTYYDHAEIGPADLRGGSWDPDDCVQLVFDSLPLEDHYRIWDSAEVAYRLSLTYQARVVGIAPTVAIIEPPVVVARIGGGA
jgi:hypothetical protein